MRGWLGGNSNGNITFGVAQGIPPGCQAIVAVVMGLALLALGIAILAG